MAGLLDTFTGGKSDDSLNTLENLQTPTASQLDLPDLIQYAQAIGMTPAQMQAFLQQNNALASENVDQTGTNAQQAALAQLADTANQGAAGNATEQAQEAQIQQDSARNLAGQRGAIDQQAQARGVPPGLLAAALQQQNAGQDAQSAHQSALQAQSQNYQTALNALAQEGQLGQGLQGQQNTQANTVANAQNAMQQFNAANQQAASAANAGYQQQANATNTANQNAVNQANTGLKNQKIEYNAQVPQTVYNDALNKATGISNLQNTQGQQNAGITSGLIGAGATILGGMYGGPAGAAAGNALAGSLTGGGKAPPSSANTQQYAPQGQGQSLNYAQGGITPEMCMTDGGQVPGHAQMPGDSPANDTVHARLSPGEAVIPRSQVQQHPMDVMRLLSGRPQSTPQPGEPGPHDPRDVAALLAAMKHMRGGR